MDKDLKDKFQYGLGAVIVLGFFLLLGGLLFFAVPAENVSAFNIMLGILSGGVGTVVGYFYGSSKGSSEKNEIIAGKTDGGA